MEKIDVKSATDLLNGLNQVALREDESDLVKDVRRFLFAKDSEPDLKKLANYFIGNQKAIKQVPGHLLTLARLVGGFSDTPNVDKLEVLIDISQRGNDGKERKYPLQASLNIYTEGGKRPNRDHPIVGGLLGLQYKAFDRSTVSSTIETMLKKLPKDDPEHIYAVLQEPMRYIFRYAIVKGKADVVEYLVEKGIRPTLPDATFSEVHLAIFSGNHDIVPLLLEKPNAMSDELEVKGLLKELDTYQSILDKYHGADVSLARLQGRYSEHPEVVKRIASLLEGLDQ